MKDVNNALRNTEILEEQLNHAAEELITGDSDDPPLSEETVVESSEWLRRTASSDRSDA